MPTLRAVNHVQITVPRGAEDAARAFYCGVLGLTEIDKPASLRGRGGLWVVAADRSVQVHIGTEDGGSCRRVAELEAVVSRGWGRRRGSRRLRPERAAPTSRRGSS